MTKGLPFCSLIFFFFKRPESSLQSPDVKMLDSYPQLWVGSLPQGGARQRDGFVRLLRVHNDGGPELPHLSSPFGGPEPWKLLGLVECRP